MGLEKIAEYKKSLKMTTDELSNKSGVPIGTLNKILNGKTKDPKLETLKSIARVLGLSLNDFDDTNTSISIRPDEHILLEYYNMLNETGQAKAREYLIDLSSNSNNLKQGISTDSENVV